MFGLPNLTSIGTRSFNKRSQLRQVAALDGPQGSVQVQRMAEESLQVHSGTHVAISAVLVLQREWLQ